MIPAQPLLALDCSFGALTIALSHRSGTVARHVSDHQASDALHKASSQVIEEAGVTLPQIATLAVTTGPGSFTGIRLGLAFSYALQSVNPNLTLVGLPTLPLLARQYHAEYKEESVTVLLDAAGGQLYAQSFDFKSNQAAAPRILTEAEIPPGPLYAPATLLLKESRFFNHLKPEILLAAAADPSLHVPATPFYLKPLAYKAQP